MMWEDDFSLFDDEALQNWRRKKKCLFSTNTVSVKKKKISG